MASYSPAFRYVAQIIRQLPIYIRVAKRYCDSTNTQQSDLYQGQTWTSQFGIKQTTIGPPRLLHRYSVIALITRFTREKVMWHQIG